MKGSEKNILVGYHSNGYNEKRNFIESPCINVTYKKYIDLYKFPSRLYFKAKNKSHPFWSNIFWDLNLGGYDILHFWNSLSKGNKPWITTFEYFLPRGAHIYGEFISETSYIENSMKLMAGSACKKLIAISEFAKNAMEDHLVTVNKFKEQILPKIEVLLPPQKILVTDDYERPFNERLKLIFVGADFFRKGGKQIIEACKILDEQNCPFELTIISTLNYGDYASLTTSQDKQDVIDYCNANDHIHLYNGLPNAEVLEKMKSADIALLPSYEETFGYSVIEAQAAGCPVISTGGAALPEINNNDVGWVIDTPKFEHNRTIPRTPEARVAFHNNVVNGIVQIVTDAVNDTEKVKIKGRKAFERVKEQHDPTKHAKRLAEIYKEALNG